MSTQWDERADGETRISDVPALEYPVPSLGKERVWSWVRPSLAGGPHSASKRKRTSCAKERTETNMKQQKEPT